MVPASVRSKPLPSSSTTRSASGPLPGRGGAVGCCPPAQPAGTGQVHDQVQPAGLDVEELAVPGTPSTSGPPSAVSGGSNVLSTLKATGIDAGERMARQPLAQVADQRLHLGQLGHATSVPQHRPVRAGRSVPHPRTTPGCGGRPSPLLSLLSL